MSEFLPAQFRPSARRSNFLPRWSMGRILVVDIVPVAPGPLVAGSEVVVHSREGFFQAAGENSCLSWWCGHAMAARTALEATQDDEGKPALVVGDVAFRSVLPHGVPRPLILAAYHAGFVRRLLGGPLDSPPHWLCLYRNARLHYPDRPSFDLRDLASDIIPGDTDVFFGGHELSRLWAAQTLTLGLLRRCRPNMMVALSSTLVPPPERSGPFADVVQYEEMGDSFFHDFE
ncbi:hypothetical protein ACMAUO_15035 [Gluconacetobacter sp. Hr-1-5]|uniref:hypothetical protein n=1 Tax=Gluconacetobacter sp. Hr-1-5 TaxID=3395370 RepID=UPI003B527E17